MRYIFICAIHYLKLEKDDLIINLPFGTVSNKRNIIENILNNDLSITTLGCHSIDEIYEASSYYFFYGNFEDKLTQKDIDNFGTSLCFAHLRQIQDYVSNLWLLRDNCVYVRDGFLYTYADEIKDGYTFKASVSTVNTFASSEQNTMIFTEKELLEQSEDFFSFSMDDVMNGTFNYKLPTQFQHYKGSNLTRKELARVYIAFARKESIIPKKILMYCSAMEALVANTTTELSHRVAERVAVLIGKNTEERCQIYNDVKVGYDTRSKIVHGDLIKKEGDFIKECSTRLDNYLRLLFQLDDPFNLSSKEMEQFYLKKIMGG